MESKLPKGWVLKNVSAIIESLNSGFACNKNNEVEDGYVHLRTHNIDIFGKLNFDLFVKINPDKVDGSKAELKEGDILFNNTNSKELVGKTAIVDKDYSFAYSNHLTLIKTTKSILPRYFVYFFVFLHKTGYFENICNKWIGQAGINNSMLKDIPISYPESLTEQQCIVAKIDRIFERLDKSIALVEENIDRAKALKVSILSKSFHEGEELPEGWKENKVDNLTSSIGSGFACNKNNEIENGYVHLRTHNIDISGNLNFDLLIKINPDKVDGSKSKLKKGDILFNNTNSKELVGKTAIVDSDYNFGYSNHLTLIKTKTSILPEYFVYYFVYLHKIGYFENICNKWIGQAGINNSMLGAIKVTFPEKIEIQQCLVTQLDQLFSRIDRIIAEQENKLQQLKAMKASVLDKAFRGEM